jgi:hypothetical protein
MLRGLPSLYKVTSIPAVDPTFFGIKYGSVFRPRFFDSNNRFYTTEAGKHVNLERAADNIVPAIYGSALQIDPASGEVADTGIDVDANLGSSFTLTFVIQELWDVQPTANSTVYPFYNTTGPNPLFGYREDTGTIRANNWQGVTSGTQQSLTYAVGWQPRMLLVASLVVDSVAKTTVLYVNGVARASLSQAVKANVSSTMRITRLTTQVGTTGKTNLEAYLYHDSAVSAANISTLHQMFTTGLTGESRLVRLFMALGMEFAVVENIAWKIDQYRQIDNAVGGALTNLARDFSLYRIVMESDAALRTRLRNRLLEVFSNATASDLIGAAAASTGLPKSALTFRLNKDSSGNMKPAYFSMQLPPGDDALLTALNATLTAAKAAGISFATGTLGTFAWDVAQEGWDTGSWEFLT